MHMTHHIFFIERDDMATEVHEQHSWLGDLRAACALIPVLPTFRQLLPVHCFLCCSPCAGAALLLLLTKHWL
jgi:hypothetical protein